MNVVNVGYKSVNCYAVETNGGYLLIDVGMPGTYKELVSVLKRKSVPLEKIRLLVVTHFHPDHCGVAQELKDAGVRLLLGDVQAAHSGEVGTQTLFPVRSRGIGFVSPSGSVVVATGSRAAWKAATGLDGILLHTPGHSDDSVTAVIDGLGAFVGDLRPPETYAGQAAALAAESWRKIRAAGAREAFPGHGSAFGLWA